METQTELQNYIEQGKQALAQGKSREAAIAYAHGAQLEPENPQVHLGLAEANLALGNIEVVQMACRRVQELQPEGGSEGWTAQALLELVERRYDRALKSVDKVIEKDPGIGYIHALRSYLLRATGQDYDASLARARATRLSYGGRYENCFPPLETQRPAAPQPGPIVPPNAEQVPRPIDSTANQQQTQTAPTWANPNPVRNQIIRTRFALNSYPSLVTTILIAINILVYLWMSLDNNVYNYGAQVNSLVTNGQYWRLFTAMFLHDPQDITHLALNMLSLYFVGRGVEIFYGKWRYLVIYLVSGIIGALTYYLLGPDSQILVVGASGAIFGVFGAVGVFYLINRRALGSAGSGAISQWIFWLGLNLVFGFAVPNIAVSVHIGGLIAGIILAFLLIPRSRRGKIFY